MVLAPSYIIITVGWLTSLYAVLRLAVATASSHYRVLLFITRKDRIRSIIVVCSACTLIIDLLCPIWLKFEFGCYLLTCLSIRPRGAADATR